MNIRLMSAALLAVLSCTGTALAAGLEVEEALELARLATPQRLPAEKIRFDAAAEPFLPGRVESFNHGHQIAAKCAARDAAGACLGHQFYFLKKGDESKPSLIGARVFSTETLEKLKVGGVTYNLLFPSTNEDGFLTPELVSALYNRDVGTFDSESKFGELAEDAAYGLGYLVLVPIWFAGDAVGSALGTPGYLIHRAVVNRRFNRLLRAVKTGKIVKIDVPGIQKLRRDIWCECEENASYKRQYCPDFLGDNGA